MRIVDFETRHAEAWRTLNEAWIGRLFAIEAKDREVLDDPQGAILLKGGRIFMAERDGEAIGCAALIVMPDGAYELAKMAVDETLRGGGIGRALMQRCVDVARQAGAPRLYIETNSSLAPALALYRSFGFQDLEPIPTAYARCDTWLELKLS